MAKIILEFDGNEEANDARLALDGYKWSLAMNELDQRLRDTTKYDKPLVEDGRKTASSDEYASAERVREIIREILGDYNLQLD